MLYPARSTSAPGDTAPQDRRGLVTTFVLYFAIRGLPSGAMPHDNLN